MNEKKEILERIDNAIDEMDMPAIEKNLSHLSAIGSGGIEPEDVRLFSARIKKLNKGSISMKFSGKVSRVAIAAAVIMLVGVTAYAASELNLFSFLSGDSYVTMRAPGDMTEREAKEFVKENESPEASPNPGSSTAVSKVPETITFDSVAAAAEQMDMKLILPELPSGMEFEGASGQELYLENGEKNGTVWLNYSNADGRNLGVTITRTVTSGSTPSLSYTIHDIDDGSLKAYKSKNGTDYTMLAESSDDGSKTAHIANTMVDEYEYALVFVGFNEAEQHSIIDSVDLTPYQK